MGTAAAPLKLPKSRIAAVDRGAELRAVLEAIRDALKEAQSSNVLGFPPLKSIEITLQMAATQSGSVKLSFWVITFGMKIKAEQASSLTLKMEPPRTTDAFDHGQGLKHALAEALKLAKVGIIEANKGTPKFDTNGVDIELKFGVEVTGYAGVEVKLLPVGLSVIGEFNRLKTHTVKLKFGN